MTTNERERGAPGDGAHGAPVPSIPTPPVIPAQAGTYRERRARASGSLPPPPQPRHPPLRRPPSLPYAIPMTLRSNPNDGRTPPDGGGPNLAPSPAGAPE